MYYNIKIKKPFTGRRRIQTSERQITRDNILDVVKNAMPTHQYNANEIDYLLNYKLGDQPILQREKNVREDINNRVVENHAKEAVDFFRGYVYGEPVQYVRKGDTREDSNLDGKIDSPMIHNESDGIGKLNDILAYYDKHVIDQEMGDWALTCGTSYRFVGVNKEGDESLLMDALDPRATFVVESVAMGREVLLGVHYREMPDRRVRYYCYTKDAFYLLEGSVLSPDTILEVTPQFLGVSIIEYPLNHERMGVFEAALPLLNAINTLTSNRLDGVEQFIQAYMVLTGAQIDEQQMQAFLKQGVICLPADANTGKMPSLKIEAVELDQTQSQVLIDHLLDRAFALMGVPGSSKKVASGGDTGSAVLLREGWGTAESKARDMETVFRKSEKAFLKLALKILGLSASEKERVDLDVRSIEVKFTRNKTDNLLTKVQALQTLLASQVDPETAFKTIGLFSDPQQAFVNSKPYLDKQREAMYQGGVDSIVSAHNEPTPEPSKSLHA